ncbi:hypothetical protein [Teredinibacter haidensis]|uniref:hypothetical protein n=1 Tax=Teredinibacter haidensis TaxID=2731755 RepID=UPI000949087B|nr:hypothetical protein [Teredinibacter haidensis]
MFKILLSFSFFCVLGMSSTLLANTGTDSVLPEKLRDPTQPLGYTKVSSGEKKLVLQAIYSSADRNEAIINGKLVRVGDLVDGAKIVQIREKSVVYRRSAESGVVRLRPNIVKNSR